MGHRKSQVNQQPKTAVPEANTKMSYFNHHNGELYAEEVPVAQLAATQAARRLPEILLNTHPVIEPVAAKTGSQLYRAQLVGLSEGTAREACRRLKEMRHSCVVVPPQSATLASDSTVRWQI